MATVTSLGFSIFSTYSGRGVAAARRDLEDMNKELKKSNTSFSQAASGFATLTGAALSLGPALIPIGTGVLGVGAALGTMGAAAGIAGGVYGIVMDKAITSTLKLAKAHKALSPVQQQFVNSVHDMKTAMNGLSTGAMPLVLTTATIVVGGITNLFRGMMPVIKAVDPIVRGVAQSFKDWTAGDGLKKFVALIVATGVPALKNLLAAGKSVLGTLGDGFRAFAPTIIPMSKAIADGAAAMKKWADNGGFANWLQVVRNNAPAVKEFFKTLGDATLQLGKAFAGLGPLALNVTILLLRLVAATPVPVLQAIILAFSIYRLTMMAMAIQSALAAVATFLLGDALIVTTGMVVAMEISLVLLVLAIAAIGIGIYLLVVNWNTVWNAIKTTAEIVWNFLTHGLGQLVLLLLGIPGALIFIYAHWNTIWTGMQLVATTVWNALKVAWAAFINAMISTWNTVSAALRTAWNATWNAIKVAAQTVWNALATAWRGFFAVLSTVYGAFSSALKGAWSGLWNAIKVAAQAVWNALVAAWRGFFAVLSAAYAGFSSALKGAWNGMWNAIKTVAQDVWKVISKGWSDFSKGVQVTLDGLVKAAKKIWDGITNIFKTPINLVIGIWDKVAGVFHLPQIKPLATGGHVTGPGGPTDDKIPAMLSNGEFVMNAKAVDHYGLDSMWAMNSRMLAGGGPANYLAGGGQPVPKPPPVVPPGGTSPGIPAPAGGGNNTTGGTSNPFPQGTGTDWVSSLYTKVKSLMGDAFMKFVTPALDAIAPPDVSPSGGIMSIPHAAFKMVEKSVLDLFKSASNIGGVIPAGQHLAIIDAALKAAGVPPPGTLQQWEAGLNTLITRESAWNAGAINRTDSNAQAGHPSQGLAQTIPSTFAANHVPGTSNNILDPVANVAAAIRYIVRTYGNITNVQQANANLPPKGYRRGTDRASAGWHMVDEDGGEWINFRGGEKVLPHGRKPKHGGDTPVYVNVENHWHGNPDKEAVQHAEGDMVESLRQACHAGVGGRNH